MRGTRVKLGGRHMAEVALLPRSAMLTEIATVLPMILASARDLISASDALPEEHARSRCILELHADRAIVDRDISAARGADAIELCISRRNACQQRQKDSGAKNCR